MTPKGVRTLWLCARRDTRSLDDAQLAYHRRRARSAPARWAAAVLEQAGEGCARAWVDEAPVEAVLLSYALDVDDEHISWLRAQARAVDAPSAVLAVGACQQC